MTNSSRATVSMPGWPGCNSTQRPPEAGSWTVDSFSRGNDLSQPSDIEPAVGTLFRREVRNRFHQFLQPRKAVVARIEGRQVRFDLAHLVQAGIAMIVLLRRLDRRAQQAPPLLVPRL